MNSGPLGSFDDDGRDRDPTGLELQSELLLQRREDRGSGQITAGPVRLKVVSILELVVIVTHQARMVSDRTRKIIGQHRRQHGHRSASAVDGPTGTNRAGRLRIRSGLQFRPILPDDEPISSGFFVHRSNDKLEALSQQIPQALA